MPKRIPRTRGRPPGSTTFDPKTAAAFGDVVRQERTAIGVSQEDLAAMAGIHRTGLSKIERGLLQPSLQSLINLATALGQEPVTLLDMTMRKLQEGNPRA